MLARWRDHHPGVALSLSELGDHDLYAALKARQVDAALIVGYTSCPAIATEHLYCERLFVAFPSNHPLAQQHTITWSALRSQTVLVQDWANSHLTRDFYAKLIGVGTPFALHAAGKQSLLALIGAGFGVTLTVESQSQATFPGVVFRPITEQDAQVDIKLAWFPDAEDAVLGRFISFLRDEARLSERDRR